MNKNRLLLLICCFTLCLQVKSQVFVSDTLQYCNQDSVLLDAGGSFVSYYWNTGETTSSIWAKRSAWYYVEVTDNYSNTILDSVLVILNRAKIQQNDTIVCYGADFVLEVINTEPYSLIGDYSFNKGEYKDNSGYDNHAFSPINMKTGTDRFGAANMALYFTPNVVDPPSMSCLQVPYKEMFDISQSFALHCWVNPDSIYGIQASDRMYYLINRWKPVESSLEDCSYALAITNNGHICVLTSDGIGKNQFMTTGDTLVFPGRWTMIDVVCSMHKIKVYINAQLYQTFNITAFPQKLINKDTYIGAAMDLRNHNYQGLIDDIKIYSTDISQDEIKNLFKNNTTYDYEYLWSNGATNSKITINPKSNKKYFVDVFENSFHCSDTVNISVYPEFNVKVTQIRKGCPDTQDGTLLVNAKGGIPFDNETNLPYVYKFPSGYLYSDSLMYKLPEGNYQITVMDSVGCSITNNFHLQTYPRLGITITAEPKQVYPQKPQVHFSTKTDCDTCYVYDYLWKFGDGQTSKDIDVTHNYGVFDEEKYPEFIVTHYQSYEDNCIDSASITLPVAKPKLKIPNAFTPNSDGVNDTFDITLDDSEQTLADVFTGNTLNIYNRQGKLVFSQNNYPGKPGTFDGKNLPDGVYFYILQCYGVRKTETYQGYLHIFRNMNRGE